MKEGAVYCHICGAESSQPLCVYCRLTYDKPENTCDGCGEPHVSYHLEYVDMWDGIFCTRCIKEEE